jgi:hypothetical protein
MLSMFENQIQIVTQQAVCVAERTIQGHRAFWLSTELGCGHSCCIGTSMENRADRGVLESLEIACGY